jgi:hypothetical protein
LFELSDQSIQRLIYVAVRCPLFIHCIDEQYAATVGFIYIRPQKVAHRQIARVRPMQLLLDETA